MLKGKRVVYRLKINIINSLKMWETGHKLAYKLGVGTSMISDIKKKSDSMMKCTCKLYSEDGNNGVKIEKWTFRRRYILLVFTKPINWPTDIWHFTK